MDYEGMLEDLRAMRKRNSKYTFSHWSMWVLEGEFIMSINDFIEDIQEILASEASYQRG